MTTIRRAGTASGATLSALVLGLGFAHFVAPRWSERVGLDVWNYSVAQDDARETGARADALETVRTKMRREIEIADHLAVRLAEGTLTLGEAAEVLAPMLRERPGFDTVRERHYRAPSQRHAAARYAIVHTEIVLRDEPDRWAAVAPRLEAEYAAMK
jgi:hypothetical protein